MIFLPIVERELRVASRKRSTFGVRVGGALVALLIGSGFFGLEILQAKFGLGPPGLGKSLFATLTWLSLAAALSAGLFFTSDCLSQEKREGTLGFLFLTDLRGYDVVLGKLLATSLRGFYALLAVLPILAVTLLMGGVTGEQFWKTSLALVNALLVSLAAGLFVSAISRDSQKALAATLLLLLLLVAAGPAGDATFAAIKKRAFDPALSVLSPGYLFVAAGAWGRSLFWPALLVNQVIAWTLCGLACFLIPRTWQEKTAKRSTASGDWARWWKFGGVKRRAVLRRKLMDVNPALWLACRERWQAVALWMATILLVGGFTALFARTEQSPSWIVWGYFGSAFMLVLYLGIASQAGRFFVEAQRNGLIELLLATPLTVRQIVQGHWRGMVRMFGMPLALCLAAQLLGAFMAQQAWSRIAATAVPPTAVAVTATNSMVTVTNVFVMTNTSVGTTTIGTGNIGVAVTSNFTPPNQFVTLAVPIAGTLTAIANLVALIWFGMWTGLTRNTNSAALKTICFVQVIPWFAVSFASALAVPLLLLPRLMRGIQPAPAQIMTWYPLLTSGVATVLYLIKDVAFTLWSRRKLHSEFRERALLDVVPIRLALPPPLPQTSAPRRPD